LLKGLPLFYFAKEKPATSLTRPAAFVILSSVETQPCVSELKIEHWNFQTAHQYGHPEVGEMGMYVDVAVIRYGGEIVKVEKIKDLKIEWERFKRDDVYASLMLRVVEYLMEV